MKKFTFRKKAVIQSTLVACTLLLAACGDSQKPNDTKKNAENQNEAKFDTNKQEKDAQFLVNASETNMEEIQLGKLAQQKGTSKEIKELGKMMEDAHTKLQRDLTALALSKKITIPTSSTPDAQEAYQKLNEQSGKDFDKEYASMTSKGHKNAIEYFEKAAANSEDTEIRNWAKASLPKLREHLNRSEECKKSCDKM